MKVVIIEHTPNPETVVATAARLCYSPCDIETLQGKMDEQAVASLLNKLRLIGHLSPFEHASFTFGIEGISRVTTHQLVRHRIASYSQQSQRYVKAAADFERIVPASIAENEEATALFDHLMEEIGWTYKRMVSLLGIPAEDARYILPNATETKIVMTMNARELLNFFAHRTCNRAQWEIRAMAEEILRQVKAIAPLLFASAGPGCIHGPCPEGSMCCGKMRKEASLFQAITGSKQFLPPGGAA